MFLAHLKDLQDTTAKPLIQFDKKKILLNNNGFRLANNICPHQGSLILTKPSTRISCRYHGWGWDHSGDPISSGNTKVCNDYKLSLKDTFETNSLIFSEKIDLDHIKDIDLSFMQPAETRIDHVKTDYKNIIDVFLDVDHIPIVHESVYDSIGITDEVEWHYYDWGNIQLVHKSTEYSQEFKDTLRDMPQQSLAAFWITVYPYTTIEWQPGAMFVNVCVPKDTGTDVCVFKYRDTRYNDKNWQINSSIWETAWTQDRTQSESIVARSMNFPHLETSKIHFREWHNKGNLS
jgi:phenylpropionate dioxygenase-like ring-hydroxylating dioxygenase large terminal subunit